MYIVPQPTNDPYTKQTLIFPPDGSYITLVMRFVPMQQSWIFENITRNSFVINGLKITNQPNMLHQWKNIIPFGLACASNSNREPSLQDDFFSGASTIYILTSDEVKQYASILNEQI